MHFRILGPLEVSEAGRPVLLPGAKARAVLAILLLRANEVVSSDRLIDELWGGAPPETAVNTLQVYVSQLRKALAAGNREGAGKILVTRSPGYMMRLEPGQLDLEEFERLVADGRAAADGGDPGTASALLQQALSLWRGPPLADLAFEPSTQVEIGRLEELRLAVLEERLDADIALGRDAAIVPELEALVAQHPLRERLGRHLLLALYRSGRQAEALAVYQATRRELVDELGIDPSPELQ